jgi:hypothetical protein
MAGDSMGEVIVLRPGGYDRDRAKPSWSAGQPAPADDRPPGLLACAMLAAGLALHVAMAWGFVRGLA